MSGELCRRLDQCPSLFLRAMQSSICPCERIRMSGSISLVVLCAAQLTDPKHKLALRVSGQLLLGLARIYSRKVTSLFTDCSDALSKIQSVRLAHLFVALLDGKGPREDARCWRTGRPHDLLYPRALHAVT